MIALASQPALAKLIPIANGDSFYASCSPLSGPCVQRIGAAAPTAPSRRVADASPGALTSGATLRVGARTRGRPSSCISDCNSATGPALLDSGLDGSSNTSEGGGVLIGFFCPAVHVNKGSGWRMGRGCQSNGRHMGRTGRRAGGRTGERADRVCSGWLQARLLAGAGSACPARWHT